MDEYFVEGPPGNFDKATLEINEELDGNELAGQNSISSGANNTQKKNQENEGKNQAAVSSRDVSNIPFKHVDIHSFFSDRNEVVERALKDCQDSLINEEEKNIVGSWLLTEISLWDTEKERLILEYNRVPLSQIDTLVSGELVYPTASLAPRLSGLAEGVSSMIHCAVRQEWSSLASCTGLAQFEPRKRHMSGIRLMWNKGNPLPITKKWNPFAKDIPWLTYASHPLFWYKGLETESAKFNVEGLQSSIKELLPSECSMRDGLIIIENYCGVGALVHNRNGLGFFKIRGKVSF